MPVLTDAALLKRQSWWKQYYAENKEKILARRREYYRENKNRYAKWRSDFYARNPNFKRRYSKEYFIRHKKRLYARNSEWQRKERATNPIFRVRQALSLRIYHCLKGKRGNFNTLAVTGCDLQFLRGWLESRFQPGMSWDNYGRKGWHVDHIIPCSAFDLSDPIQVRQCFHYSNLQPLWAEDNLRKASSCNLGSRG